MEHDLSRAQWRKSGYSGNTGNCVEVANLYREVAVKNSQDQNSPELFIKDDQWRFLYRIYKTRL
jgi:hypothetical protein